MTLLDLVLCNRSLPSGSAGVPPAKDAAKMAALPGTGGGMNGYRIIASDDGHHRGFLLLLHAELWQSHCQVPAGASG
jgi:hypothetical protein